VRLKPHLHFNYLKICKCKQGNEGCQIVVEKKDSVRIYSLCANCEQKIRIMGKGEVSKNEDVYII